MHIHIYVYTSSHIFRFQFKYSSNDSSVFAFYVLFQFHGSSFSNWKKMSIPARYAFSPFPRVQLIISSVAIGIVNDGSVLYVCNLRESIALSKYIYFLNLNKRRA